ncbi:hypothetical protein GGI01_001919 [Coemansia sp. RSA 376]|nr:hypothetical protein GGH13_000502 [Coemansia sp. S155-1]KAJ2102055.1 hypothetical protein GGI09_001423 [Coemansia sp. S100]KAJ2104025.1 hypothetical protein GGI16_002850 [Coemansia sp. S142-1]KAJ2116291.1 hypothetical protein IW146_001644 [Coemansia sp. RSA 922]KAJ2261926.1 hypothetical protein GGI01_001919 [Coemansia sp. RSA 376]
MSGDSHSISPDSSNRAWPVDIPSARSRRNQQPPEAMPGESQQPQSSSLERSLPMSAPTTPHYTHSKEMTPSQPESTSQRLLAFGPNFQLQRPTNLTSDKTTLLRPYGALTRHKRTCSANSSVRTALDGNRAFSRYTPTTSSTATPLSAVHANLGRRSSIAITNLSIAHGLSIDPDILDMDDDDGDEDSDDERSSIVCSASLMSDEEDDDDSDGSQSRRKRKRRPSLSGSTMPRNRAVVRLQSLVEEEKQALASEMEHESQITRSIRHNNVQEWLRASPANDATRDSIPFPASPVYSSSSVSSPRLAAAVSPVATRPLKRKSVDDGYPYKRQAMSPLGLRAQIAIGRRGGSTLLPHSPGSSSRSSPSSPQLMARPVAVPVSHLSASVLHPASVGPTATAGTCPATGLHGAAPTPAGLSPAFLGSRGRSRSGTSMAVLGANNMSFLQPNGGFSRMNINDPMDDEP